MHKLALKNKYTFICRRKGVILWREDIENLIPTIGLNDILDKYFKGSSYTAGWFVGLIDNAGFSALASGDTLASHTGWTEFTNYTGVRKALTLGTVLGASVDNSANKAEYTIGTGGGTINGGFVCSSSILYGEGSFTTPRALSAGDILEVLVTLTSANG